MTPKHYTENTSTTASDKPIFDASVEAFVVSDARRERWGKAYPGVDVTRELAKAAIWWADNPAKRRKDIGRFLTNWMSRAERGFPGGNGESKREPQRGDPDWLPTESELEEILSER